MSVPRARAQKPNTIDEIARVLRIARLIDEELRDLGASCPSRDTILAVAERIAARTEDEPSGSRARRA